ncbi:MAG: type II toxin-antitoxin system YoeB family toxin [Desulfobacteraceae bacterium]|nr:type II toxin-antitoxin system YoeB family toxin [Desulfobacteraceae bacterium]
MQKDLWNQLKNWMQAKAKKESFWNEAYLSGYWSTRINNEHRIVYKIENESILIAQLRYHY